MPMKRQLQMVIQGEYPFIGGIITPKKVEVLGVRVVIEHLKPQDWAIKSNFIFPIGF